MAVGQLCVYVGRVWLLVSCACMLVEYGCWSVVLVEYGCWSVVRVCW